MLAIQMKSLTQPLRRVQMLLLFVVFFLGTAGSFAQIRGIITDSKNGKPLEGVQVFINQSAIGTLSDKGGAFQLTDDLPLGYIDLILFKKGYRLFQSSLRIESSRLYNLNLSIDRLASKETEYLSPEQLSAIESTSLKSLPNNQYKLIFNDQARGNRGKTQIELPFSVENNFLGYRLTIYANPLTWKGSFNVPVRFEYLATNGFDAVRERELNRKNSYKGSLRHFLLSLSNHRSTEQGYTVTLKDGQSIHPDSLLEASSIPRYFRLRAIDQLHIRWTNAATTQHTVLKLTGPIDYSATGRVLNAKSMHIEGGMALADLGSSLPIEYKELEDLDGELTAAIGSIYESVYVHTDKPYYYPGEPIWFKAYMNYFAPDLRNSISKTLYVELIHPSKKIVLRKQLALDSGFTSNDFILPDTLTAGVYFLRSYTHSMRNFGEDNLFVKQIPILSPLDKVDHALARKPVSDHSNYVTVTSDKSSYKTRERIKLSVQTKDDKGLPVNAHLSISVTDAAQVIDVPVRDSIERLFPVQAKRINQLKRITFPVETGVSLSGYFLNDKGKKEKTGFDVIQWTKQAPQNGVTDDQGDFWLTGFNFYDSASFLFKSEKAKNSPYGKFQLQTAPVPVHALPVTSELPIIHVGSVQRIVSEFEVPKGDSLLNIVQVKGKKIEERPQNDRANRTYGKGDYVLSGKNINPVYTNLLYSIAGKVPGLIVDVAGEKVFFRRAAGLTYSNDTGPMVTINDVPMFSGTDSEGNSSNAGALLAMIDPATVESIEFTSRINVLYGSQGAQGVIAIYTKQGVSDRVVPANFQQMMVPGYNRARLLLFPDYSSATEESKPDYRSTVYWKPNLITKSKDGTTEVSFFSADLPGIYHVVIEGVTSENRPVRTDYYFEIESR